MLFRIIAIVVTCNARPWIDRCLSSLLESDSHPDILVVDNASTDGTPSLIREKYPQVELLARASNIGFGQANNVGLKRALEGRYDFAYLLNQDAWVPSDCISRLVAAWRSDFGILSPVQLNADGRMDRQFAKHCGRSLEAAPIDASGKRQVAEVPFVMAAHWLLSREAIDRVGGFSPAFIQYGEDDNYADRVRHAGLKIGVVPDVTAVHDRGSRKESAQGRMNHKCLSTVVKLSDPGRSFLLGMIMEPVELLGMTVKNFSIAPARYIGSLVKRYPELARIRKESEKFRAFLD